MEDPVYVNVRLSPTNHARFFEEYATPLQPHNAAHGVEVLAGDPEPRVIEGEPKRSMHVLLKFPSAQAFDDWYNAPEYQPLKAIRLETTDPTKTEMLVLKAYGAAS